jgi:hypothetical protein
MKYDIVLSLTEGVCNQTLKNCTSEQAVDILNQCFTLNDIDIQLSKNTFYNMMSRPSTAPQLIKHLIKTRQIHITKHHNYKLQFPEVIQMEETQE